MKNDQQRIVDDYLTRTARKAWPNASVTVCQDADASKDYQLEVPGEKPFVLGTVFGPARAMLRAIVSEHLPSQAARSELIFEPRVIRDERKPSAEDLNRAVHIATVLRDESNIRTDAVLAGKLITLAAGGAAFTLDDIRALRRFGATKGPERSEYDQLADALAYWCDLGDPQQRSY